MKVLLINTHEKKGGAGQACHRLFKALQRHFINVSLLVQYSSSEDKNIHSVSKGYFSKVYTFLRFSLERFTFMAVSRSKEVRFAFSPANAGIDISQIHLIKEADVLHLHWVNQGFLSVRSLLKLKELGKPVVWTLHDEWAFTGGCHYSGSCNNFMSSCHDCPFLKHPSDHDLSARVWKEKQVLFQDFPQLTIVTCSSWLQGLAAQSTLLSNKNVLSIPNCIDTDIFRTLDAAVCREQLSLPSKKKLILFGAMNTSDKRKGFQYLLEALDILKNKTSFEEQGNIGLVIFGKSETEVLAQLPFQFYDLGIIRSEESMATAYCAADLYVLPSLEDNLPNTVMESLSCSTPVVAFTTGGIPEMVDHLENGYLAKYKSSEDLAEGLHTMLFKSNTVDLALKAREKVLHNYTMEIIAGKHLALYRSLIDLA